MLRADELIVDNFAGGGGASTGIEMALQVLAPGRHVDVAINHDPEALALHAANHPKTRHYCQSVWKADPRDVVAGLDGRPRPIGLAWFSPDCKHFSKAKGGKPVEKKIRDLAWVVVHWAKLVRPRIIMLENVEEFRDWGPLIETADGKLVPCPLRKGLTFKRWIRELRKLGYVVEHRELRACDYSSAPTIRKRLYLIARCDRGAIVWPQPTHERRAAAECIDFSIPCPSIFDRKKDAAFNTQRRISRGTKRYVLQAEKPFIVGLAHGTHAERPGARCHGLDEPIRTLHAGGGNFALCDPKFASALISRHSHHDDDVRASSPSDPMPTLTGSGGPIIAAAHLTKFRTGAVGSDMREPAPTVTANSFIKRPGGAAPIGLAAAFLVKHYGGHETPGTALSKPIDTVTAVDHHAIAASHLVKLRGTCADGQPVDRPMPTLTGGGTHIAEVRAFLVKYFGTAEGAPLTEPMHTVTARDRFGLATAALIEVETDLPDELRYAAWWMARFIEDHDTDPTPIISGPRASAVGVGDRVLVDIGMRMLTPRELYRAQGFSDDYIIDPPFNGKPMTKTAQIRMCGNSVCPPMANALVLANFAEPVVEREVA